MTLRAVTVRTGKTAVNRYLARLFAEFLAHEVIHGKVTLVAVGELVWVCILLGKLHKKAPFG